MKCRVLLFFSVLVFLSCSKDKRLYPNTSLIQAKHLQFERVDTAVFNEKNLELKNLSKLYYAKKQAQSRAYKFFVEDIMRIGEFGSPMTVNLLHRFIRNKDFKKLQLTIDSVFGDLSKQKAELDHAFSRAGYFLPDLVEPKVVFYNTGFNVGVFPDSAFLGLGLDMFIGKDNAMLEQLPPENFPQFKRDKMQPSYLVPDALKGYLLVSYQEPAYTAELLSLMIFYGKVQLLLSAIFPDVPETTLLAYSPEELKWCKDNEKNIWKELIKDNLLFTSSDKEKNRWTNDGPFTSGLPQESAARLGVYMGYQIVKAYFDDNKQISLHELMQEKDFKTILRAYKPF